MNEALQDCEQGLKIEANHFKHFYIKVRFSLVLNRYFLALEYFKATLTEANTYRNLKTVNGCLEKCKKLEFYLRIGAFDISDWILSGFNGKFSELFEYVGAVYIRKYKKNEISERGLFPTKNIDYRSLVLVTTEITYERGIPSGGDSNQKTELVIWENFVNKTTECISEGPNILSLVSLGLIWKRGRVLR